MQPSDASPATLRAAWIVVMLTLAAALLAVVCWPWPLWPIAAAAVVRVVFVLRAYLLPTRGAQ